MRAVCPNDRKCKRIGSLFDRGQLGGLGHADGAANGTPTRGPHGRASSQLPSLTRPTPFHLLFTFHFSLFTSHFSPSQGIPISLKT
jgi:hypothetical protein